MVDRSMYAQLHGRSADSPITLDELLDLEEIEEVGRSWASAKQRNLEEAADNASEQRKAQSGGRK